MTPAQVLADFRNEVYEVTADYWTDAEAYGWMWHGETLLARRINCTLSTDTSITTVAATKEYTRPTGVIKILRATWNSVKLAKIDYTDLDRLEGTVYGGVTTSGNPVYYYEYGTTLGLSPTPASAETLKLWKTVIPTVITASSTALTIPAEFGVNLIDYMLYRAYLKDKDDRAQVHLTLWEKGLKEAERDWNSRNKSDRHYQVRDESEYPISQLGII